MEKDIFLNLSIEEQVEYLNKKLEEGQTVIRIREDLGIGEKALQKIIKSNGYKYNQKLRKYVCNTEVSQKVQIQGEVIEMPLETDLEGQSDTLVIQNKYKNDLLELIKYKSELLDMLKDYKLNNHISNTTVIQIESKGIIIDGLHGETVQTSIRVNKEVINEFREFSKAYKQYKSSDLISMALKEYMENHR